MSSYPTIQGCVPGLIGVLTFKDSYGTMYIQDAKVGRSRI
jgi:hypothetical protein